MFKRYSMNLTNFALLSFLCLPATSFSQALFEEHQTLDVTIEAPLTTLMKVRSDVDYLDGTFSYNREVGVDRSFDLKLRARGRYRRQRKTCPFPPVRLNFKTSQVEGSLLEGQDKLKLITHCNNRLKKYEQLVMREFLAYRILQTLTNSSFRSRLLRITYVNNEEDDDPMIKYGFVIEDDENLAKRIELKPMQMESASYAQLDAKQTNLVNLFQYLIGNTDFSLIRGPEDDDCCHNSVPFAAGDGVISIPYDFDFSGLVNAPYAEPNPKFRIKSVKSRYYRGRCTNNEHLPETIQYFQSKKQEIMGLVDDLTALDKRNRQQVTRYLNDFFEDISDEDIVTRKLLKRCS